MLSLEFDGIASIGKYRDIYGRYVAFFLRQLSVKKIMLEFHVTDIFIARITSLLAIINKLTVTFLFIC